MSKNRKEKLRCRECKKLHIKWVGQCDNCHAWNSIEEITTALEFCETLNPAVLLKDISETSVNRKKSGWEELDSFLGGGFYSGSVSLVTGSPGLGKTTFLLHISNLIKINNPNASVLYVSSEECLEQIAILAKRMNILSTNLHCLASNCLEDIISEIDRLRGAFVIIDSIQRIYSRECQGRIGSSLQVIEVVSEFVALAKKQRVTLVMSAHITKAGEVAGPKALEHLVDSVCYLRNENQGDQRNLSFVKNRFGPVGKSLSFKLDQSGVSEISNSNIV